MEAQLRFFLFVILLTSGASFKCEECSGKNKCTGKMTVCAAGEDACAILLMESLDEDPIMFKKCATSKICNSGPINVKLNKGNFLKENISCCMADGCAPDISTFLKKKQIHNGKACPACNSVKPECPKEVVYCAGNEDQCISLLMIKDPGNQTIKKKGCTTVSTCVTFKSFGHDLIPGYKFENVSCVPAPDSQVKGAPPLSGFFLVALLLVEMFIIQ